MTEHNAVVLTKCDFGACLETHTVDKHSCKNKNNGKQRGENMGGRREKERGGGRVEGIGCNGICREERNRNVEDRHVNGSKPTKQRCNELARTGQTSKTIGTCRRSDS